MLLGDLCLDVFDCLEFVILYFEVGYRFDDFIGYDREKDFFCVFISVCCDMFWCLKIGGNFGFDCFDVFVQVFYLRDFELQYFEGVDEVEIVIQCCFNLYFFGFVLYIGDYEGIMEVFVCNSLVLFYFIFL